MEEILRLLAISQGVQFEEHGYQVGDRVRMVNVDAHNFEYAADMMQNGEEGTVVHVDRFLGIMPVFEVRPDSGKTMIIEGELLDRVPFGSKAFDTVVKIEGGK